MKIVPCSQGTNEWLFARAGIVTASDLGNLVSPTWKARTGQMPESYLYEKLAERCMGAPIESGGIGWAGEQGSVLEKEALPWLSFTRDIKIERVGFVTTDDGLMGCSPDGLIGEDGGLEAKCPQPSTHLKYLLAGGVPDQYLAQVYGSMYVTGRAWWLFMSYSRNFPPLVVKVERDEKIMEAIAFAVLGFNDALASAYAKIKAMAHEEDPRPLPPHRQFRPLVFV